MLDKLFCGISSQYFSRVKKVVSGFPATRVSFKVKRVAFHHKHGHKPICRDIREFIEGQENENTIRKTTQKVALLEEFLSLQAHRSFRFDARLPFKMAQGTVKGFTG